MTKQIEERERKKDQDVNAYNYAWIVYIRHYAPPMHGRVYQGF